MTSINKLPLTIAMIISLLSLSVYAQSPDPKLNHLATREVSFDYPAGYSVADESTTDAHKFIITRKGSSTRLTIVAPVISGTTEGVGSTPGSTRKPIFGGVLNGKALALPIPAYPPIARAAHAAGTVVVQVLIDEEGNVVEARALSGHPLLQAASVAAAREARFSPTRFEGEPVKVKGLIQYNFVAQ